MGRISGDIRIKVTHRLKKSKFGLNNIWTKHLYLKYPNQGHVSQQGILPLIHIGPGLSPLKTEITFRRWSNIQQSSFTAQVFTQLDQQPTQRQITERKAVSSVSTNGGSLQLLAEHSLSCWQALPAIRRSDSRSFAHEAARLSRPASRSHAGPWTAVPRRGAALGRPALEPRHLAASSHF